MCLSKNLGLLRFITFIFLFYILNMFYQTNKIKIAYNEQNKMNIKNQTLFCSYLYHFLQHKLFLALLPSSFFLKLNGCLQAVPSFIFFFVFFFLLSLIFSVNDYTNILYCGLVENRKCFCVHPIDFFYLLFRLFLDMH